jgi:hypothetical protein
MRLRELAGRRVSAVASATSLQPLSAQEVRKVAGGIYFSPDGHGGGHWPFPSPGFPGDPGGAGPLFPEPLPNPEPSPYWR